MLAPNPGNYLFPRGRQYFRPEGAAGHLHLGNVPEYELTPEISEEKHYESMSPSRKVDLTYETERSLSGSMTLEEFSAENINVAWLGDGVIHGSQAAGAIDAAEKTLADNLYIDLGKTDLSVLKVSHGAETGGSFGPGDTVTGGTSAATGEVAWAGDGYVELINVSGTFQAGETITASAVSATTSRVEKMADVVVADAATPTTRYVAGTDYDVDVVGGLIRKRSTGSIGATAFVSADHAAMASETIRALSGSATQGELLFIGDPERGPRPRVTLWKVKLILSGGLGLISEDLASIPVDITVLADTVNHPAEPYMRWEFLRAA